MLLGSLQVVAINHPCERWVPVARGQRAQLQLEAPRQSRCYAGLQSNDVFESLMKVAGV